MKLLGWMHRKLMQNETEPLGKSTIGSPSTRFTRSTVFHEQNYYLEPTNTYAENVEMLFQEQSFEFLSIGTLGMELVNTDPPTPTLFTPFEQLIDQQTEVTENDLNNLINYELEKFFETEEHEMANDTTSGRSSQASIITISNKPIEGDTQIITCPLQNYLFATSIELDETDMEVKKVKTSLGELFKRNDIALDDPKSKCKGVVEQGSKRKNVTHLVKKVVNKLHSSSRRCTDYSKNAAAECISVKKKFSKALKMFRKEVHPEEMNEKQITKKQKGKNMVMCHEDGYKNKEETENKKFAQADSKKNNIYTMKPPSNDVNKGASTVQEGQWIKTDLEYLVLEL